PVQAGDEPGLDRVNADAEDDRNCRGRRLGCECGRTPSSTARNHADLSMNQISRQGWESIVLAFRPTVFDCDVLALNIAGLVQALPEGRQTGRNIVGVVRSAAEIANHRHCLLLCAEGTGYRYCAH